MFVKSSLVFRYQTNLWLKLGYQQLFNLWYQWNKFVVLVCGCNNSKQLLAYVCFWRWYFSDRIVAMLRHHRLICCCVEWQYINNYTNATSCCDGSVSIGLVNWLLLYRRQQWRCCDASVSIEIVGWFLLHEWQQWRCCLWKNNFSRYRWLNLWSCMLHTYRFLSLIWGFDVVLASFRNLAVRSRLTPKVEQPSLLLLLQTVAVHTSVAPLALTQFGYDNTTLLVFKTLLCRRKWWRRLGCSVGANAVNNYHVDRQRRVCWYFHVIMLSFRVFVQRRARIRSFCHCNDNFFQVDIARVDDKECYL